jgi:LmbE family N-acetylglucosaminyl deacetylase
MCGGANGHHGPPLLVVSPHLDDAVLSCGALLAGRPGAIVCTVFAAAPSAAMHTEWDGKSGFSDSSVAIRARIHEDTQALAVLNAVPFHLAFRDAQYHESPSCEVLVNALSRTAAEVGASSLLMPLGLFHSDHVHVSDACLGLLERNQGLDNYIYEDLPYRSMEGVVQQRLHAFVQRGLIATPADPRAEPTGAQHTWQAKCEALRAYASQLRALDSTGAEHAFIVERFWRLTTKPR